LAVRVGILKFASVNAGGGVDDSASPSLAMVSLKKFQMRFKLIKIKLYLYFSILELKVLIVMIESFI